MKTKLTTRAVTAHSMLPDFAVLRPAPMSRTCTEIAGRVRHRLRLLGAALLLAAAPLGAEADQIIAFMPPAAWSKATHYLVNGTPTTVTVADVSLFNACPDPDHVRSAKAGVPGAFASAQAAKGVGQFAVAGGDSEGGANAEASLWMFVRDPQNRPTVKLSLTFKGFAASGPPEESPVTSANFILAIGNMRGTPSALVDADGCTTKNADSIFDWMDPAYQITGYSRHQLDLYGNVEDRSALNFYTNGVLTASKPLSSDPVTLTFDAAPNQGGSVILVRASAGGGGMAVIDPIITAHPDNPDVEIEITAPAAETGQRPLDGFTAEDLTALGIDPQPFINLGFLAPATPPAPETPPAPGTPSDTMPPSTFAAASQAPNADGWNYGPVSVKLAAADNAGGSGVKEIHIAFSGATIGSRVETGSFAYVDIAAQGETTLTYFAVDNAGNEEAHKTLTVRIH